FANAALNTDLPSLSFHQPLHQRKTQAFSLHLLADAHKPAEYCRKILFGDSFACVPNADVHPSDVLGRLDGYPAAAGCMTDRIRQQVIEDGRDRAPVSHHPRQVRPNLVLKLDLFAFCNRAKSLDRRARQLDWPQTFEREPPRPGLDLGKLEQVAYQLVKLVCV